jgi:RNase H-fold protein (predicted Holliday junction resolvase)
MAKVKNTPKILGLDVSTKTIGWALFDYTSKELLELTHFSPKLKPIPESKTEQLLLKSDSFREVVEKYRGVGITKVIIEEPLLNSNNIFTVSILMRYNAFIMKIIHDVLGVIPELISTYDSRKFAFPSLFVENKKGKKVLFGGYEKGCDKKHIIWQKVSDQQPHITWGYTRNNTLKKENFDMTDAYACVLGHMQKNQLW